MKKRCGRLLSVIGGMLMATVALADDIGIAGIQVVHNGQHFIGLLDFRVVTNSEVEQFFQYTLVHKRAGVVLQVVAQGESSGVIENPCPAGCVGSCADSCAIWCGRHVPGYCVVQGGCGGIPQHFLCGCSATCPGPPDWGGAPPPFQHIVKPGDQITASAVPSTPDDFPGDDPGNNTMTITYNP